MPIPLSSRPPARPPAAPPYRCSGLPSRDPRMHTRLWAPMGCTRHPLWLPSDGARLSGPLARLCPPPLGSLTSAKFSRSCRVSGHSRGPLACQARAALSGAAWRTRASRAGLAAPPPSLAGRACVALWPRRRGGRPLPPARSRADGAGGGGGAVPGIHAARVAAFFLVTGAVGFLACFWFVCTIYAAIKID